LTTSERDPRLTQSGSVSRVSIRPSLGGINDVNIRKFSTRKFNTRKFN
jgi:hypothetical protein